MMTTGIRTGFIPKHKTTATDGKSVTYTYNNGLCDHMLPCGHCRLLGYKCPYYGSIDPIRYDKVTC